MSSWLTSDRLFMDRCVVFSDYNDIQRDALFDLGGMLVGTYIVFNISLKSDIQEWILANKIPFCKQNMLTLNNLIMVEGYNEQQLSDMIAMGGDHNLESIFFSYDKLSEIEIYVNNENK